MELGFCKERKICLNLINFANRNSINTGYYFVLFLWTINCVFIILWSWMVTIIVDLSVTSWRLGF